MKAKAMCDLTGVDRRTLDFWVRSKLISASVSPAAGAGSKREYSMADAVECRIAVVLRAMGIETFLIPRILEHARDVRTAFIILDPSGDVISLGQSMGVATFQPHRTAMLIINVAAIRAEFALPPSAAQPSKSNAAELFEEGRKILEERRK